MLATAHLLRASGAEVRCGVDVRGVELDGGMRVTGVRTSGGDRLGCAAVVNAAGVWAGEISAMAGTPLPVTPRRGFVLVTEALGAARGRRAPAVATPPIRHTVYGAGYAGTIAGGDDRRRRPPRCVTSVRGGAVLIGASRERVGFDRSWSLPVLRRLAAQAVALFPFLADVSAVRAHRGFRPDTPDRLPIIGPDPWIDRPLPRLRARGRRHRPRPRDRRADRRAADLAPVSGGAGRLTERLGPLRPVTAALAGDPFAFDPERFG